MEGSRIILGAWSCIDVTPRQSPQTSTDVTSQIYLCWMTACILADDSWKSETFSSIACVPCFTSWLCFITVVISFTASVYRKLVLQVRKQDLLSLLGFFQSPSLIINIFSSNFCSQPFGLKLHYLKTCVTSQVTKGCIVQEEYP